MALMHLRWWWAFSTTTQDFSLQCKHTSGFIFAVLVSNYVAFCRHWSLSIVREYERRSGNKRSITFHMGYEKNLASAYKIERNLSENLLRRRILLQIDRSLLIGEQSLTSSLQNLNIPEMMRVSIRREAHTFMESLGYVYAKDIGRQSLA